MNNITTMKLRDFLIITLGLTLVACCVTRQTASDETRVQVHTETVFDKDTVFFEIPVYVETIQTRDTSSVLENIYSQSQATVSGGILTHILSTKPYRQPVEVQNRTVYRDSIVYVDKIITNTVEVQRQLTSWQRFLMSLGSLAIIALFIAIARAIYKLIY